jgi:anti-sigma B factor antagonist
VDFKLFDRSIDAETHVIELHGEVDIYTAPAFEARMTELIDEGKPRLVVDLSSATFIDSTALGVLARGRNRMCASDDALALVCTDEKMLEIFDITGFDRLIPIHETVATVVEDSAR